MRQALGLRRDVPHLLAASDIMLSTSRYGEGSSNAIAEAMAVGLPVVATDVGDAKRIIGDAGIIVPPRNPQAILAALWQVIDMPNDARRAIGTRARERIVKHFSRESLVSRLDALHRAGAADARTEAI